MKIYKISIDNNPGGWKSGEDPHVYVIAKNKSEALEKVRNGWGDRWEYDYKKGEGIPIVTYMQNPPDKGYSIVKNDSVLSTTEIRFDGFDVHIKKPRQAKLERIEKNIKRNKEKERLKKIEENLLNELNKPGKTILRKFLSSDEIKVANKLVKEGKIVKGRSDDKQQSVQFYVD